MEQFLVEQINSETCCSTTAESLSREGFQELLAFRCSTMLYRCSTMLYDALQMLYDALQPLA